MRGVRRLAGWGRAAAHSFLLSFVTPVSFARAPAPRLPRAQLLPPCRRRLLSPPLPSRAPLSLSSRRCRHPPPQTSSSHLLLSLSRSPLPRTPPPLALAPPPPFALLCLAHRHRSPSRRRRLRCPTCWIPTIHFSGVVASSSRARGRRSEGDVEPPLGTPPSSSRAHDRRSGGGVEPLLGTPDAIICRSASPASLMYLARDERGI